MKKANETNYVVNTNIVYHTPDFWTSTTSQQFNEAMVMFNSHNIKIAKNGIVNITASAKRNYIKLDDIMDAVRPLLAEVGLYIEQHLAGDSLITRIVHISGEFIASKMHYQTMEGGNANSLQRLGGGLSYLKRYSISAILNIVADEDSDGEGINNVAYKSAVSNPAPAKQSAPAPASNPDQPWLNMRDKKNELTDNGKNAILYLQGGGNVDEIKKKYKISKSDMSELLMHQAKFKAESEDNYQAESKGMFDDMNNESPF
jgi:hypothetical protein